MPINFTIITPTYNRPQELKRALESIFKQNYKKFELIIVNDSPDSDYEDIENIINNYNTSQKSKNIINTNTISQNDNIIKYFKNLKNMGKNYSCNLALENICHNSDYIIFLDDDDWLEDNALQEIYKILSETKIDWLVTNRYDVVNNISLTKNTMKDDQYNNNSNTQNNININSSYQNTKINYLKDYLILKKFKGDATHIISTKIKDFKNIKFSKYIKNAEEWFYFAQIDKITQGFVYKNINSTLTIGYNNIGLTQDYKKNNVKNKIIKIKNTFFLFKECIIVKNINPYIMLYFILRLIAIMLKR